MWPGSAGNEAGQLAEMVTTTNANVPLIHPCLVTHAREYMGRSLCTVVEKRGLNIEASYFWGANEEKRVVRGGGTSHAQPCRSNSVCLVLGIDLAMCYVIPDK